jgi:hypothetical protein
VRKNRRKERWYLNRIVKRGYLDGYFHNTRAKKSGNPAIYSVTSGLSRRKGKMGNNDRISTCASDGLIWWLLKVNCVPDFYPRRLPRLSTTKSFFCLLSLMLSFLVVAALDLLPIWAIKNE